MSEILSNKKRVFVATEASIGEVNGFKCAHVYLSSDPDVVMKLDSKSVDVVFSLRMTKEKAVKFLRNHHRYFKTPLKSRNISETVELLRNLRLEGYSMSLAIKMAGFDYNAIVRLRSIDPEFDKEMSILAGKLNRKTSATEYQIKQREYAKRYRARKRDKLE